MRYVIGTRKSKLAMAQAESVKDRLAAAYPQHEFAIQTVKTKGDLVLDKPLHEIGGKGLFVKEVEEKLLNHEIDIGVHSMKDMPAYPAGGLMFCGAWEREDARDALILREKRSLKELAPGAVIATGSKRREFQLKRLRPDIRVVNIRGNVDTRLRKMEEEKLDGIVLAAAGLHRLGLGHKITAYFSMEEMIPAPAQGALALEIRENEDALLQMLDALSDAKTEELIKAERGFLQEIGGDCHIPIGAACQKEGGAFKLRVMYGNETGSRQAYVSVQGRDPKEAAKKAAVGIRKQMAGLVSLVGAGPGEPGLITVKGQKAIREADCILYDRLASDELLNEAKQGCELIYVGKQSHNHTMKQEEINRLLVEMSMKYDKTVRLKGGDVYVFGRGGEEGLYLEENGVHFEVIPGVSSAIAGLAYAGIPITHRGLSMGFHVVTAHDRDDKLSDIDFAAMASGKETCVFLMGLSKVKEITQKLIEAGMPRDTKAAVISNAALPRQKTCVSDLAHLAKEAERASLCSPALIVAGDVVSLRDKLNFYETRPLFGKRYLLPVIGEANSRLGELLRQKGAFVKEVQAGKIVNRKDAFTPGQISGADWMVFTSKNGVQAFFENLFALGLDVRALAGCKIASIGDKTSELLKSYGINADLIPEEFHSTALAEALKRELASDGAGASDEELDFRIADGIMASRKKVLYFKAENADSHLKQALQGYGKLEEIVVYENVDVPFDVEEIGDISDYDGVIFTCASLAARLAKKLGDGWGEKIISYSIGPKTTACLKRGGAGAVVEAKRADYEGVCERVCED